MMVIAAKARPCIFISCEIFRQWKWNANVDCNQNWAANI